MLNKEDYSKPSQTPNIIDDSIDYPLIILTDSNGFELDRIYYDPETTPESHKKALRTALQTALDIIYPKEP